MPLLGLTSITKSPSFPRKRESNFIIWLDSRFRGNDGLFGARFKKCLPVLFAVLFALAPAQACARASLYNDSVIQDIAVAGLPPEARDTLHLIKQDGPFPYPRDGVVFGNYEKRLPQQPRGHYREYTVKTPGARNRGARRIVCGPPPECYYTADHYRTFQRIKEQANPSGGQP